MRNALTIRDEHEREVSAIITEAFLNVRRAADFRDSGEYVVTCPAGSATMYRDPENGMWYETPARTGKHFSELFLGFTKAEAAAKLASKL